MEVLKSSRFWLALAIIASGTIMAIYGVKGVEGGDVLSNALALMVGFGVAKTKKLGGESE